MYTFLDFNNNFFEYFKKSNADLNEYAPQQKSHL